MKVVMYSAYEPKVLGPQESVALDNDSIGIHNNVSIHAWFST